MPNANPDIVLHMPQPQRQAVEARLTAYLLQAQYAFMQSFAGNDETTFDIFLPSRPEGPQPVLRMAINGISIENAQDHAMYTASRSAHAVGHPIDSLIEQLVAVCTAPEDA